MILIYSKGFFHVYITEETTLKQLKKLVASAKLLLDEKEIDDDCLKGIKLYHTNTDANDDSFDEKYSDDELALRHILKNGREIDLKMFTASVMTKIISNNYPMQVIFHKSKEFYQIHPISNKGGYYHLKSYPLDLGEKSIWVSMFIDIQQILKFT